MQFAGTLAQILRCRLNWDTIGVAFSIAIIAAGYFALYYLVKDIDVGEVGAALRATSRETILLAGVLVALSYGTLTFYDFFALRTIGQNHVPYRVAAFTGVLAYTFGHSLGATVLTAGVVRLRIYRAWGLGLLAVTKIAFITGLTFWLGNAVMLGVGAAYVPEAASAINQAPPWINRAIALACLAAVAGYLLWLLPAPRTIGWKNLSVTLPSARLTVVQIVIGMADLSLAALAMVVLISAYATVDVIPLMVTFVFAALLGFVSHAPGSLGVFDAALLVGLPQVGKEQLLAALLIFRLLYFVVPFCLAIAALGLRELWLASRRSQR